MKSSHQRILMFLVALPLLVIIIKLPYRNHLPVNAATVLFSSLGALEFRGMLKKQELDISVAETIILGGLSPLAMALGASFNLTISLVPLFVCCGAIWVLISRIFAPTEQLKDTLKYIAAGFSVLMYPGMFMLWIIRMTHFDYADQVLLIFMGIVIANDSAAWAFGMLFGKGNRGVVSVSPNKSIAGFAGGIASSTILGICAALYVPQAFSVHRLPMVLSGFILGFCSGIAAIVGDLAESAIKRSSGVKDSGVIVPGRGGVLDSIDSIAFTAPVFCGLYWLLFR